ncbi:NAD(P)-binding protein [Tricholoma matsutake]|nr:NAD(P)-binding protein [Tricholoma matsutake 945]
MVRWVGDHLNTMPACNPTSAREYYFTKLGSYNNLSLRDAPIKQPKASEVLVKVHAISLQFRDLLIANGTYPVGGPDNLVPCSDMAGEIVAIGEEVKGWKQGNRVCANFTIDHIYGDLNPAIQRTALGGAIHGVLTEYRIFPAHSLIEVPNHLSYEEASTLPCAAVTAYNALMGPVPLKAGDYVLVLGTGGVSIFALQLAVASGATVIATSSSDEKLKIVSRLGARHVINYKSTPNWDEEVLKITNGVGVDHVIEVGGHGTLPKFVNSVRMAGQLHMIGVVSQERTEKNFLLENILKSVVFRGIQIGSVAQFKDMIRLMCANPETTRPVVDKVFRFEETKEAYAYLESQAQVGKVVIKVSKE